ncbi:MAG: FkbM family methyltransferase, partial [Terriglobia bacterium]
GEWRMDERCEVPTAPLSTILQPAEIKAARIIKIDVEGAEWQVVSGLAPLIGELRRDVEIVVEVTPSVLEAEGRSGKDLLRLFGDCGFHSYRIENDYSAASYYARITPSRPERIKQIPAGAHQADLVFSRVDASSL